VTPKKQEKLITKRALSDGRHRHKLRRILELPSLPHAAEFRGNVALLYDKPRQREQQPQKGGLRLWKSRGERCLWPTEKS